MRFGEGKMAPQIPMLKEKAAQSQAPETSQYNEGDRAQRLVEARTEMQNEVERLKQELGNNPTPTRALEMRATHATLERNLVVLDRGLVHELGVTQTELGNAENLKSALMKVLVKIIAAETKAREGQTAAQNKHSTEIMELLDRRIAELRKLPASPDSDSDRMLKLLENLRAGLKGDLLIRADVIASWMRQYEATEKGKKPLLATLFGYAEAEAIHEAYKTAIDANFTAEQVVKKVVDVIQGIKNGSDVLSKAEAIRGEEILESLSSGATREVLTQAISHEADIKTLTGDKQKSQLEVAESKGLGIKLQCPSCGARSTMARDDLELQFVLLSRGGSISGGLRITCDACKATHHVSDWHESSKSLTPNPNVGPMSGRVGSGEAPASTETSQRKVDASPEMLELARAVFGGSEVTQSQLDVLNTTRSVFDDGFRQMAEKVDIRVELAQEISRLGNGARELNRELEELQRSRPSDYETQILRVEAKIEFVGSQRQKHEGMMQTLDALERLIPRPRVGVVVSSWLNRVARLFRGGARHPDDRDREAHTKAKIMKAVFGVPSRALFGNAGLKALGKIYAHRSVHGDLAFEQAMRPIVAEAAAKMR
jgi:hypothetical protein